MKPRVIARAAAVVALGVGLAAPSLTGQEARAPRNAAEFDDLFKQVSNWGRWGKDDQLGSVNLITPTKRKQAIALAKTGESVSLAHNPITERAEDHASPFEHTMLRGNNMDRYAVSYHGYAHADVNTDKGCTKLGIDNLKNGVITRGVLVDIPRLKGVKYLEPGTAIYAEDLDAWEKKSGVKIAAGDALPIHTLCITAMGINLLDNQDLEAVADAAARLNRWEFMLTIAPVPVTGGTGFPLNALATF